MHNFCFVFIFELWILCIFNVFCNGEVFWRATFGPLTLLTQKIKILKKWKNTRAYYHFTLVYHKWRSWCMVSEISSMTDRIFLTFCAILSFYPTDNLKNQKWKKMAGDIILHLGTTSDNHAWFLRYGAWQTGLFSLWIIFCPFTP